MRIFAIIFVVVFITGCGNSSSSNNQSATLSINDIAGNWEADTGEYRLSLGANDTASISEKFNDQEPTTYAPIILHDDSVIVFFPSADTLIPGGRDSNHYGPDTLRLRAFINHIHDSLAGIHGGPSHITFYRH